MNDQSTNLTTFQLRLLRDIIGECHKIIDGAQCCDDNVIGCAIRIIERVHDICHGANPFDGIGKKGE